MDSIQSIEAQNAPMDIVAEVEAYCARILQKDLPKGLSYHNLKHTKSVAKAARKIAEHEGLQPEEKEVVLIAAWFHDTGFRESYDGHEDKSKEIAETFLRTVAYAPTRIAQVLACIDATRMPQSPNNKMEEVLCDADLVHLSKPSYFDKSSNLRKEWEKFLNESVSDTAWFERNLILFEEHTYFTDYGKQVLEPAKQTIKSQLAKLSKQLQKKQLQVITEGSGLDKDDLKELQKKIKKAGGRAERGIETMFRLTSRNHIRLSSIADSKANIMISVNTGIIGFLITFVGIKLDSNLYLRVPTIILLTFNLVGVIFAILATRPNVSKGRFEQKDIEEKKVNLLFFGNFYRMNRKDYQWGMKQLMDDGDYLYSSLIDDIYFLGVVLGRKYRLLRIAYNVFMFGLIISVIAYLISIIFFLPVKA